MTAVAAHELLTPLTLRRVRAKARWLSRQRGFARGDADDLRQELLVRLLQAAPRFDPARSPPDAFVALVLRRGAANLLSAARTKGRCLPHSGPPTDAALSSVVEDRRLPPRGDPLRDSDRRHDVAAVLDRLPDDIRLFAALLAEHGPCVAARRLGWTRSRSEAARAALDARFRAAGFEKSRAFRNNLGRASGTSSCVGIAFDRAAAPEVHDGNA